MVRGTSLLRRTKEGFIVRYHRGASYSRSVKPTIARWAKKIANERKYLFYSENWTWRDSVPCSSDPDNYHLVWVTVEKHTR